MRIAAFALHGNAPWPDAGVSQLDAGLNVFHGPPASGKTAIADLVAHALCGRRFAPAATTEPAPTPEGELIVESGGQRFRLRRSRDNTNTERLTVAGLDGAAVDHDTVRALVYGLSPTLLGPMFAVNFREPLRPETLLAGDFAQEFRATIGGASGQSTGEADAYQPIYARIRALEWELTTLTAALGYRRTPRRVRTPKPDPTNGSSRASHFLAMLTDGELVRLQPRRRTSGTLVVNRAGSATTLDAISSAQRDQVYLSLCLALVSACARCGAQLPLVLDEPFVRLDRRGSAALAAVLDDFARRGQQVLVFTARREAVERFVELGATTHDLLALTQRHAEPSLAVTAQAEDRPRRADDDAAQTKRQTSDAPKKRRRRAG